MDQWLTHLNSRGHFNLIEPHMTRLESVELVDRAFKSKVISYKVLNKNKSVLDVKEFLNNIKIIIEKIMLSYLDVFKNIKINFKLHATHSKITSDDISQTSFNTKNFNFTFSTIFDDFFENLKEIIQKKSDEFQESESGWSLEELIDLELNLHKNNPFKGSSYLPLPEVIQKKHAVINIKNDDDACFAWAVVSALHPKTKNSNRTTNYPHYKDKLNLKDINFPIKMRDIPIFEKNNNISINVFGLNDEYEIIGPYHHTSLKKETHVNLLLIEEMEGSGHYCWIKNLSRLVSSQLSKNANATYICDGCLVYFKEKRLLERHQSSDCNKLKTILPDPGTILSFKNEKNQMKVRNYY